MIDEILDFLLVSSQDPKKWSASFKFALLGIVPIVVQAAAAACNFGLYCLGIGADGLNELVNALSAVVFYGLSAVASVGFVVAFVQKLVRTAKGENRAIWPV